MNEIMNDVKNEIKHFEGQSREDTDPKSLAHYPVSLVKIPDDTIILIFKSRLANKVPSKDQPGCNPSSFKFLGQFVS